MNSKKIKTMFFSRVDGPCYVVLEICSKSCGISYSAWLSNLLENFEESLEKKFDGLDAGLMADVS